MGVKMKKTVAIVVAVLAAALLLSSCKLSQERAVGVWKASYVDNGKSISSTITLNEDGTYTEMVYTSDVLSRSKTGVYVIDGDTLLLRPADENTQTAYKYSAGRLVNGNHAWMK